MTKRRCRPGDRWFASFAGVGGWQQGVSKSALAAKGSPRAHCYNAYFMVSCTPEQRGNESIGVTAAAKGQKGRCTTPF